tara:strand:- start:728 stop:1225 length:498 start_codon:yes stop_codon:yes gene_type:complete
MTLKTLAILGLTIITTSCSLLPEKKVNIVSKPVEIDIIQPTLPRPLDLQAPKWYVVSEARIANPCRKVVQEDGTEKRPKTCAWEDKENPEWPEGYTYLDRFLDDMKDQNNGEVVFVATTVGDYKVMIRNNQEVKRYIKQLGEVIVVYRNVTMKDGSKGVVAEIQN